MESGTLLQRLSPIWTPHPGQREFLEHPAKIAVLACGRRWGKTDACAARIVGSLFQPSPKRHVLIAPTLDQARLLFNRVVELLEALVGHKVKASRTPYPRLEFDNHRVAARSGHLGRSLRGNEATDIVVDEAAFVPEELITEIAMPMLATTDGSLSLISTPRGLNHFWRFFQMGQEGRHGIWSQRAPSLESPYVSESFLQVQRELISERAFRTEYEAEFIESEGRVFRTEAIDACLALPTHEPVTGPFQIGVDWGRYQDFTAVAVVCGLKSQARLVEITRFQGDSWREQVQQVAHIIGRYAKPIVRCDATGLGDPLTEGLINMRIGAVVRPYVFSAARKNELLEQLVWMIENATLRMEPHVELLRELQHFEATETASGNRRLSARSGYHDDLVVALALATFDLPKAARTLPMAGEPRQFAFSTVENDPSVVVRFSVR